VVHRGLGKLHAEVMTLTRVTSFRRPTSVQNSSKEVVLGVIGLQGPLNQRDLVGVLQSHNPKVVSSNLTLATKLLLHKELRITSKPSELAITRGASEPGASA
jgi:hypothetical protein